MYKVAVVLRECLLHQRLTRVELRGIFQPQRFAQHPVEQVLTFGKHLVVLAGPLALRVHLGMHGAWHRHQSGRPRGDVVLATGHERLICRQARDVELFWAKDLQRHPVLTSLGPDLLGPEPDYDLIVARARAHPDQHLGEVLLDQRVAAGLGNVYKSELAFLGVGPEPFCRPGRGLDVWAPLKSFSDEDLRHVYRRGREALWANVGGWHRTTTVDMRVSRLPPGHSPVWVYGRGGGACLRCRAEIQRQAMGLAARSTYWCPRCQA